MHFKVLVEKISNNFQLIVPSYHFALEIDGIIILSLEYNDNKNKYIGKFFEARIYFAEEYDLYVEVIIIL